ncbi:MAG: N-acetylmuramoyl-L-alanine amidase [Tissierellales bacterium]|jgi:N-acetylmuramoyl-L-alanine amidase|nr:N-acetylmuramoyl-L-alanine amidase [Tissierellales bacterium]
MKYKIIENFITPNKYSRPQRPLKKIKALVIHWVANPNSSAKANRNYFENRKGGNFSYGSAHEIIDLDGDVMLVIPPNEMAYHVGSSKYTKDALARLSNYPNDCTYGIECTHIDWDGNMTKETLETLANRCADLCRTYDLNPITDIWTHKQVVGWKNCPKYFVDHRDEFEAFKIKVKELMKQNESIEKWQQELGEQSLEKLANMKIIDSPDAWKTKMSENIPNWLFFTVISRLIEKGDDKDA